MRCEAHVLRNGYFTGRRCARVAHWLIGDEALCTQHMNQRLARGVTKPRRIH